MVVIPLLRLLRRLVRFRMLSSVPPCRDYTGPLGEFVAMEETIQQPRIHPTPGLTHLFAVATRELPHLRVRHRQNILRLRLRHQRHKPRVPSSGRIKR